MERLTIRTPAGVANLDYPQNTYFQDGTKDQIATSAFRQRAIDRLAVYEDTGLTPEEIKDILERYRGFRAAISDETGQPMVSWTRASKLLRADKEGRVVVLPCKPSGVTVYQLRGKKHALGVGVSPRHISCATVWADGGYALHHQGADDCQKKDFGKTWFLTRVEAEAALSGGKGNV